MKAYSILVATVITVAMVAGCGGGSNSSLRIQDLGGSLDVTAGTVTYINLPEGLLYAILGEDGSKLEPVNLAPEFQKDGLRIRFKATAVTDRVSVYMWGELVELSDVQVIE